MKKLTIILTAVFLFGGYTLNAQMHPQKGQDSKTQPNEMYGGMQGRMMQGGMMGNMMQGRMMQGRMCPMCGYMMGRQMPMQKYMMMVNMLPYMQESISLSGDQTEQLIDMQTNFKQKQVELKAELMKNQMKLKDMLKNDASATELENQMKQCSDIKISMKIAAYETANNMKGIPTEDQRKDLENMMMHQGGMMNTNNMNQDNMMHNQMNQ